MAGTDEPVAVLGIRAMGQGMAASALRAGIPVIVWDRRMEATRDLAGRGAQVAASAAGNAIMGYMQQRRLGEDGPGPTLRV